MGKLSAVEQRFVIRSVAGYMRPTEVAAAVLERFGKQITPSAVLYYDPTSKQGSELSAPLRTEFARERRRFHKQLDNVPIHHVAYRLQRLQDVLDTHPRSQMTVIKALVTARLECEMAVTSANHRSPSSGRHRPPA